MTLDPLPVVQPPPHLGVYTRSFTSPAAAFPIPSLLAPGAHPMSPTGLPRLCSSPAPNRASCLSYAINLSSRITLLELSHPRQRCPWVSSEAKCITARHSIASLLGRLGLFLCPKPAAAAPFRPGHRRTATRKDLLLPREKGLVCLKPALGTKFLAPLALGSWEGNRRAQGVSTGHFFYM